MKENGSVVNLTINEIEVSGYEGDTILETARAAGIHIPTLCQLEGLSLTGACRMCIVEVEGINKLVPACVTRVADGMTVRTTSEKINKYRRMIVELLFAERNHTCAVCVVNGHCDLQSLAQEMDVTHVNFEYRNPKLSIDSTHPLFACDHNRCVLCGRCVRVCDEIEGANTRNMRNRGINTMVITDFDQDWGDASYCTNCGKCVQVCPTGALYEKGKGVGEMVKNRDFLTRLAK